MISNKPIYSGKVKSRKELAQAYGISQTQFNLWIKEVEELESLIQSERSLLRPKEITILIEHWGDFRSDKDGVNTNLH